MDYDIIIIGAGCAGAAAARVLAERGNKKVLVLDRRGHVGGNAYDFTASSGITVHKYGPHIFHTNDDRVFAFLKNFTDFSDYSHTVTANIHGKFIPVPFNFNSIDMVFGDRSDIIREKLLAKYPEGLKIPIYELTQQDDAELSGLADYIFQNVFSYYTEKQWGVPIGEVSRETLSRVPVLLSRDNRYFTDKHQGMPTDGYTAMFTRMLDHPNIELHTSAEASERLAFSDDGTIFFDGAEFGGEVIYTGAADELFGFKFGRLPYRTLDFTFETLGLDSFQPNATVNYTVAEPFTRITEFKKLTGQSAPGTTVIMKEYSRAATASDIPYYAILNPSNLSLYAEYAECAAKYQKLHLLGRLAEYRYYNMDAIIGGALTLCDKLI